MSFGAWFAIDDDPIEARASDDLGCNGTGETAPQSDLPHTFCERLPEGIAGQIPRPFRA